MHYLQSKARQRGFIINPYAHATAGGGTDPYFANVVSLLHFDGVNDSTTFTDQTGKTWTITGGSTPKISTAQSVFGGASGLYDGSTYMYSADHADWDFGSGDFTLEGRVRFDSTTGNVGICAKPNAGNFPPFLIFRLGTALQLYASSNGTSFDVASAVSIGTVAATTWYGWAVTRSGNDFYTFLDGTQISTFNSSATLNDNADPMLIGTYHSGGPYMAGYMDEFRATKGVARYTGNYTLDASAFPNS